MLYTRLCALLNIDHPILNAPMSGTATGTLAAAVSNAGGFGMIGGTTGRWLRSEIATARTATARPFGVGGSHAQGVEPGERGGAAHPQRAYGLRERRSGDGRPTAGSCQRQLHLPIVLPHAEIIPVTSLLPHNRCHPANGSDRRIIKLELTAHGCA